jgi:3-oxoacid CoA-transferase subunit A/3-oxoadipate CoA-transferase alpha subunit
VTVSRLASAIDAVAHVRTGDTVMVGGFGLVGAPLALIDALVEHSDATDLTIVSNNIGEPGLGLGRLLRQGRIRKGISSYFTSNPEAVAAVNAGEIEATLVPQGTFAEAIRAGGAGIGGFFTPTAYGTIVAEGKETRGIDGKPVPPESRFGQSVQALCRQLSHKSAPVKKSSSWLGSLLNRK